jgi:hypothetical protein
MTKDTIKEYLATHPLAHKPLPSPDLMRAALQNIESAHVTKRQEEEIKRALGFFNK